MKTKTNDAVNGARVNGKVSTQLLHDVADLLKRVVPRSDHEASVIESFLHTVSGRR